jgi:hypothetical protein
VVAVISLSICILIIPLALYRIYDSVTFMQGDGYTSVVEAKKEYNPGIHTVSEMSASEIAHQERLNRRNLRIAEESYAAGTISHDELLSASVAGLNFAAEQFVSNVNRQLRT